MGDLLVANLLQSPRERHGFYPSVFLPFKSEFLTNLDTNQLAVTLRCSANDHKRKQRKFERYCSKTWGDMTTLVNPDSASSTRKAILLAIRGLGFPMHPYGEFQN